MTSRLKMKDTVYKTVSFPVSSTAVRTCSSVFFTSSFSGLFLHRVLLHHMCHRVVAVLIATNHKLPRVAFLPHPLPSPLLRQYIISCLPNTWRQSQQGNYWGHSHVCTQPSLTHRTSFRRVKRPCCCKGRVRAQQHGLVISPWHVIEIIQQTSLRLD